MGPEPKFKVNEIVYFYSREKDRYISGRVLKVYPGDPAKTSECYEVFCFPDGGVFNYFKGSLKTKEELTARYFFEMSAVQRSYGDIMRELYKGEDFGDGF